MKKISTILIGLIFAVSVFGQIPQPKDFFGFQLGADYKLAGWDQIVAYFNLMNDASDKLNLLELGKSTEGKPFIMAVISAKENLQKIDRIKRASRQLADSRGIDESMARQLAQNEKIIVLITCSIHATEVGAAQAMPELVYDLITNDTEENKFILDNVVFLLVPSFNPDGLMMVKEWYDQHLETEFEGSSLPWLYQLYTGHDNNRDAVMLTQVESQMVTRVLYKDWLAPVYLDMHQMGNRSSRIFVPPFIDPLNPNIDPLIVWEMNLFGNSMALDLESHGKSGVGSSHSFTGWWQGAFLMTAWWHNTVGLLTELASCKVATPIFQTKRDLNGSSRGFSGYQKRMHFPNPWPGGWWRLRDIVEYDLIAAKAVLYTSAVNREKLLYNRYLMGKHAIEAGKKQPPFAFLVPPQQKDKATTASFLQTLMDGGVEVHQATASFMADELSYPRGTHVILMSQPFRAYAKDLLEIQTYPDIREGGTPIVPYDAAGWTLPLQMGVKTVKVTNSFRADLKRIDKVKFETASLPKRSGNGFILVPDENQSYVAVNRLLKKNVSVLRLAGSATVGGQKKRPGAFLIPKREQEKLQSAIENLILSVGTLDKSYRGKAYQIKQPRVAMYKPWTSSMHEGWSRWLLERYEFSFKNIHNEEIRVGNLIDRYDAIYFPDMNAEGIVRGREEGSIPPIYAHGIGTEGLIQLKKFVEAGGTLIMMDSASDLVIGEFGLPVVNTLKAVSREKFYCPGSILAVEFDPANPITFGMAPEGTCFFARSPAFKVIPNFKVEAKVAAKYPAKYVLKSGYLLGEEKIKNKAAIVDVPAGEGHVILIGFDAINRIQAHATFKILFNAILQSSAQEVIL